MLKGLKIVDSDSNESEIIEEKKRISKNLLIQLKN